MEEFLEGIRSSSRRKKKKGKKASPEYLQSKLEVSPTVNQQAIGILLVVIVSLDVIILLRPKENGLQRMNTDGRPMQGRCSYGSL